MRSCKDKGEMIIYIIIIKAAMNDEGTADFKTEFISGRKQAPHIIQSESPERWAPGVRERAGAAGIFGAAVE